MVEKKIKKNSRRPKSHALRETSNFDDPMVPLGHGKWQRASECPTPRLKEVVTFLEKNVDKDKREGIRIYNRRVLEGAKNQLAKKG